MTLRRRLISLGIPLVVLPLAASLVIFSLKMADSDQKSQFQVLRAELAVVEQRVSSAWGVLSRVGFANSDFYRTAVAQSVETSLPLLTGPGETALVFNSAGTVLLGPASWKGKTLGTGDPWLVLLKSWTGESVLSSDALTQGRPYLVTYKRFAPWGWTVVIVTPQERVWQAVFQGVILAVLGSLVFLALAVVGFWFLAREATRPLVELQSLAAQMGQGHSDLRAGLSGPDEVVMLAREWNAMADRVHTLTSGLEQRVDERTRDLAGALVRAQSMQDQLILSEKMASLGQLVAGIAHELNTPLGAIGSAQSSLDEVLGSRWPERVEVLAAMPADRRRRLWTWLDHAAANPAAADSTARRRLRKQLTPRLAQHGVLDPEEAADRLVEVGLTEWSDEDLAVLAGAEGRPLVGALADLAEARLASALVRLAVSKAERVIGALRIYSRHDPARESTLVPVAEGFQTVLTLFQARLKTGIEVVARFAPGVAVRGDADRFDQLWTNLISNALASMGPRGRLGLDAFQEGDEVVVRVSDTGPGIPLALQPRVFTPFFTTKKAGEGSGLGLSICQTIVREAGGTLTFRSVPGDTVFEARFPCR